MFVKGLIYSVAILLITASIVYTLAHASGPPQIAGYATFTKAMANPVPFFVHQYVPQFVEMLLRCAVGLVTARRIYLWVRAGAFSPRNMTLFQLALIFLALCSIAVQVLNDVFIRLGRFDLIPGVFYISYGVFLLAPSVLWVETVSIRDELRSRAGKR